jgi:methionyl-tRNA synthetase
MCNKYFEGKVPEYTGCVNTVDEEIEKFAKETVVKFEKTIDEFEFANTLQEVWNLISRTNKYIDETAPWSLSKENKTEELKAVIYHLIENLRRVAILLRPFMEETSENMFKQLGIVDENLKQWDSLESYDKIENAQVIEKGEPLFMRLNTEEEVEYLKNKIKK